MRNVLVSAAFLLSLVWYAIMEQQMHKGHRAATGRVWILLLPTGGRAEACNLSPYSAGHSLLSQESAGAKEISQLSRDARETDSIISYCQAHLGRSSTDTNHASLAI